MDFSATPVFNADPARHLPLTGSNATLVPGVEKIGCGYDVINGGFADDQALKPCLFDLGDRVEAADTPSYGAVAHLYPDAYGYQYVFPSTAPESTEVTKSGSSIREFQSNITASVSLEGDYAGFSGSVSAAAELNESRKTTSFFVQVNGCYTLYKLQLDYPGDHRDRLRPEIRDIIDTAKGRALTNFFDSYGGYYVSAMTMGGRLTYSSIVNTLELSNSREIEVKAKASYKAVVGSVTGEARAKARQEATAFDENSVKIIQTKGGDIPSDMATRDGAFDDWKSTIEGRPAMIDFDMSSLRPVWDLVAEDNDERREELKQAFFAYAEAHGVLFENPDLVPIYAMKSTAGDKIRWFYTTNERFRPDDSCDVMLTPFHAFDEEKEGTKEIWQIIRYPDDGEGLEGVIPRLRVGKYEPEGWHLHGLLCHTFFDKPDTTDSRFNLFDKIYRAEHESKEWGTFHGPKTIELDPGWKWKPLAFYAAVPSPPVFVTL